MAAMLVESYSDDFHPENFTDTYREELQQLVDAKLEGGEAFETKTKDDEGEDAEVVDLLAALERSVARRKGSTDKGTDGADEKPAKKAAAKTKTPAKPAAKTAAKKTSKAG
jgi:DNA end-binding protein Ku